MRRPAVSARRASSRPHRCVPRRGLASSSTGVPGTFPGDAYGTRALRRTALFEHANPKQGDTRLGHAHLQLRRNEVRNFLLANALFWGSRIPRRRHARRRGPAHALSGFFEEPGDWVPNKSAAARTSSRSDFLRELNTLTHGEHPGTIIVAEESTSVPRDAADASRRPRLHLQVEHGSG